ncbi:MAG: DUF3078 domain-containing protein [Chlorobi bacterium]|nr:DUF3078 domain-containing protein [Chlorobiota bacterium]
MNMKKYSFLIFFALVFYTASAVRPADTVSSDSTKAWTFKSLNMLAFNQIAFLNWASGGESSLSSKISTEYDLQYKKDRFTFDHNGKIAFGLVGYIDKRVEKTDDLFDLLWAVSHKTGKNWHITGLLTFKSQFANGYKYPDDSTKISTFLAPGYINISVGLNFKPEEEFHVYMSPLAGKLTMVLDQNLANSGAYGVKKAVADSSGNILVPGENLLSELGVKLLTSYKKKVMKNIDLRSTLSLYNNYTDYVKSNRWNIDVDWDTRIVFTINKLFSSVLYFHLKYDDNTLISEYEVIDGIKTLVSQGPRLQLKESFGLSLSYKI